MDPESEGENYVWDDRSEVLTRNATDACSIRIVPR